MSGIDKHQGAALAVSPDGSKLYVTGFVGAQGPLEFGTVAYEA